MKAKLSYAYHLFLSLVLVFIAVLSVYWWYQDDPYVVLTDSKESNLKIKSGEALVFTRFVCNTKQVDVRVSREIFSSNKETIQLSDVFYTVKPMCEDRKFVLSTPNLEAGLYRYETSIYYNVNPMKLSIRHLTPIYFEVE